MKLYRNRNGVHRKFDYAEATLDDLKAALADHKMVAVPVDDDQDDSVWFAMSQVDPTMNLELLDRIYKAMIKAAEGLD